MRRLHLAWLLVLSLGAVSLPLSAVWAQPGAAADESVEEDGVADEGSAQPVPRALDKWNDKHSIPRSSKSSLSWPKMLGFCFLFFVWVKSGDWINRDTQIFNLSYGTWNPAIFAPFLLVTLVVAFPILVGVSNFLIASIVLSLVYLVAFVAYVVVRNGKVQMHQKVYTPSWFRYEFAYAASKVGVKIEAERKAEYEKGAAVDLMTIASPDEQVNRANLLTSRQSPGYVPVKEFVAEMVKRRSDKAMLDYTQQSVVTRFLIDGVWHSGEARDRESGDVMLAVMKSLSNLDISERQKKQFSKFAAKYEDHSYICELTSQGVKTGERVLIDLLGGERASFKSYKQIGMREKLHEQWEAIMSSDMGIVIIAGMPEGGVTTLTDVSLSETDRLLRDFVSVEDANHREQELENIDVKTYDPASGETLESILPKLIRTYPNVYVVRDLIEPEAAKILLNEVRDNRLLITNVHAKEAPEALLRMLQKKVPHRDFAATVTAVLCTRLIRMLCEECKVGYEPGPDLLKKLGIPPGKIEKLYRVPKQEEIEKPCKKCNGLGFHGRTGLFELLVVDDRIREILLKQPKLELLNKAARAAGMRSFQEEGILLVARGFTSLAELQRVLKT